jgi:hypothetical protein
MTQKSEGKHLSGLIEELGISKSDFGVLIRRTGVMVSLYCNGWKPIPHWVWAEVESMKKLPKEILAGRIEALRPKKKRA